MILLIDNYDSFVHNLARHFQRLGLETVIFRNDMIDSSAVRKLVPEAIVFSPGPCTPQEAGNSLQIVRDFHQSIPMLGVCLGHQILAEALGGNIIRAPQPVHGRTSDIEHSQTGLFAGLSNPLAVCRYHSLIVDVHTLPDSLVPTGWIEDETLMAFEHRKLQLFGVQFHPEAILTEQGYELLANFLRLAGITFSGEPSALAAAEQDSGDILLPALPKQPVTF